MKSASLPEPKFEIEEFFMVTLLRYSYIENKKEIHTTNNVTDAPDNVTDAPDNVTDASDNVTDASDNVTDDSDNVTDATDLEYDNLTIQIINIIKSDKFVTLSKIASETDNSKRTIQRKINQLKEKEKIKRVGNPKSGFWELIDRI
jgi:predicted HTH transcriptional regulator